MAVFNEPTKWQTSLVNSGDANVIPQSTPVGTGEASFDDGFPQITQIPIGAGGIAPDRKDFNGLFKILGDSIFYMQNGGLWSYNSAFDYAVGRVVLYNGNLYKCIQANGVSSTVVTPDSGTAYWQRIDNFVRSVNGVNADTQGNVTLNTSSSLFMPDYDNGILITSTTVSNLAYTPPANGVIVLKTANDTDNTFVSIKSNQPTNYVSNTSNISVIAYSEAAINIGIFSECFVQKNKTVYLNGTTKSGSFSFTFYPFKKVEV